MQFGFEGTMTGPVARRQRFVEDSNCAVDVAGTGFGLGKGNLEEPVEDEDVLLASKFDAATHVLKPNAGRAALRAPQALEKDPERSPEGQIMIAREFGKFDTVHCGARHIATQQRERSRVRSPECARDDMG